jgi:K+-sensing histidine kinase KdpD
MLIETNSIDASPKYGLSIEIAAYKLLHQNQPGIMIQVRDAGKGISPEELSRVFEPFLHLGNAMEPDWGWLIARTLSRGIGDISIRRARLGKALS